MKELSLILDAADRLRSEGQPFALATVVKINGSAYRQPGARMLVTPEGETVGTVSGGCLEGEVAQQALRVLETGAPTVAPFDLADDDFILGYGLGCDGTVHVLLERVAPEGASDPLRLLAACQRRRQAGLLVTVIAAPETIMLGRRRLFFADGPAGGSLGRSSLEEAVHGDALQALASGQLQLRRYEVESGTAEVLFEVVPPPVRLAVFGSEHDVRPVIGFAQGLGWPITLIGQKPASELARRFPEADEHLFLMHPEQAADCVPLDARTAAVVMNHNYERDKVLLRTLLGTPVPYVGLLGARRRFQRLLGDLRAETTLPQAAFDRLRAPIGLDIGTETPHEIGLSIVAEVQAVLHGRGGGPLRERDAPIHAAA